MSLKDTPQEVLDAIQRGDDARKRSLEVLKKRAEERTLKNEEEEVLLQEIEVLSKNWVPSAVERARAEGRSELFMGFDWIVPGGDSHPFSRYPHYLVYRKLKEMYDSSRILVKTKSWVTTGPDWPNEDEHAVILEIY